MATAAIKGWYETYKIENYVPIIDGEITMDW
jgi:hypothetical protein